MKMTSARLESIAFYVGWVAITAGLADTWRGWAISVGLLVVLWSIMAGIERHKRGEKSEPTARF
jgi:hypothetical protein